MSLKTLITVALLLFVTASVGVLLADEIRRGPAVVLTDESDDADRPTEYILAIYFHNTARCPTCRLIERMAHEIIETMYATELSDGRIAWQTFNMEQPENAHFIGEYDLTAPSLVLARFTGGEQVEWKLLGSTWQLVHDQPAFEAYVVDEMNGFLESL